MADLITRTIKAWAHDSYRGVMLPAMGATSCSRMRAELSDMMDEVESLRTQLAEARQAEQAERSRSEERIKALEADRDKWIRQAGKHFAKECDLADRALTRREGERYMDYVARASLNPIARKVKLADLADNTLPERANGLTTTLRTRYNAAVALLSLPSSPTL